MPDDNNTQDFTQAREVYDNATDLMTGYLEYAESKGHSPLVAFTAATMMSGRMASLFSNGDPLGLQSTVEMLTASFEAASEATDALKKLQEDVLDDLDGLDKDTAEAIRKAFGDAAQGNTTKH